MLINYCDVFLSFVRSFVLSALVNKLENKGEEEKMMDVEICIHELVYDYKVTSSPED
jgi:hypothetical protein